MFGEVKNTIYLCNQNYKYGKCKDATFSTLIH